MIEPWDQTSCELIDRQSGDMYETMAFFDCDGKESVLMRIVGRIGTHTYRIAFQYTDPSDVDHFNRAIESLTICDAGGC